MEDNTEIVETDVEIEEIEGSADAFLTTAVVFGTGTLTGLLLPRAWRKTKAIYAATREKLEKHKKLNEVEVVVQEKTKKEK